MAQVFGPGTNFLVRSGVAILTVVLGSAVAIAAIIYRSPVVTQVGINKEQPIPFSHERHVGGNAMDCRFCHSSVEKSNFAGIPTSETCMTCHSQVLADAALLQPLHDSWNNNKPLEWTRVYDLPDFVYFDHSIHIAKGVGCTDCHGQIDEMPLTHKVQHMSMSWCLECHRAPEKFIRPADQVFDVNWQAPKDQIAQGLRLVEKYNIKTEQLTNCSICHR